MDETSSPNPDLKNKKRLKASLNRIPEHRNSDLCNKKSKSDDLFWNLCIVLVALIVLVAGSIVYNKFSQLPDPIQETRNELLTCRQSITEKQKEFQEIQAKTAPKSQLLTLLTTMEKTIEDIETTQKDIEKEKTRIAGIRGEIRSYFERYRIAAQTKAKGRKFPILQTTHSGKQFLNVEILQVNKDSIRIIHEQGTTTISSGDLPDEIRELLAFGDPLNINVMQQTDSELNKPAIRPTLKQTNPVLTTPKKGKVIVTDLDPPSDLPKIETPTQTAQSLES